MLTSDLIIRLTDILARYGDLPVTICDSKTGDFVKCDIDMTGLWTKNEQKVVAFVSLIDDSLLESD